MITLPQIHLFVGNQQLKIDEGARAQVKTLLERQDPELCLHRFDVVELLKDSGAESFESRLDELRMSCETMPFLADRVILRIDHLEKLKKTKGKKDENGMSSGGGNAGRLYDVVLGYLSKPPEYCGFILTATGNKETEVSSPILKAIKARGKVQKFVAYDDDKPVPWIIERAKQKQLHVTQPVAQLLVELVGNDLSALNQELEKLSLLYAGQATVTEEHLLEHVQSTKHFSVFRITQALSQKDLVSALETLDQILLESSSEHIRLFVLVSQQFVKTLNIHYLWSQGLDNNAVIAKLKVHPFLGKRMLAQARTFTCVELENIVIELAELDLQFKFNAREARTLFQNLFQNVCIGHFKN